MPGSDSAYDAIVVGSGPNGLAAAVTLAQAGWSVQVREAKPTIGGGTRSAELTLPGFIHDVCSAIHPLGLGSPFLSRLPLRDFGLEFIQPDAPLAHPLDDGSAVVLERSVAETAALLGPDAWAYRQLIGPFAERWHDLAADILGPLPPFRFPRHPLLFARFGLEALWPAHLFAKAVFRTTRARALFAGIAAHSILPLEALISGSFGIVLGALGHAVGWPVARGGSQKIADALAGYLRSLGGEIVTGVPVDSIDELPPARAVLFDVSPRHLAHIAAKRLPPGFCRSLERYRYGPGIFKVDWALDGAVPWKAPECARAATLHLGGTLKEIAASEWDATHGKISEKPYVLVAQQSLFDSSRTPQGKHTLWGYCHVPNGSTVDMTARIEAQIERFAPGFRDRILARHVIFASEQEQRNANYIGGDINGGMQDVWQLFTRPTFRTYRTPTKGIYLCSASTPPGGGVHGMSGYHAAQAVLDDAKRSSR